MKKTLSFEKKIEFPSMIGEITSISLDHNLKFIDECNIEGNFLVSGTYKLTEASRIEESFNYELPSEIILGEKIDIDSGKINIEDFYYEIENDYTLICYIEVKIEGVEIIEIESEESRTKEICSSEETQELEEVVLNVEEIKIPATEEVRECDGDYQTDKENKEEEREEETMPVETKNTVSSLFETINESDETYSTYSVYILREEETISSLINKYKTTKEELESYNDLSNLSIGSKVIIPFHEE